MIQVLKDMIATHGTLPRPIFHGKHINIKIQLCLLKISILCILLWLLTCIQKLEVPSCTIYFYYFYCNNRNILHILVKDVHLQSPIYLIIKTTRANKQRKEDYNDHNEIINLSLPLNQHMHLLLLWQQEEHTLNVKCNHQQHHVKSSTN